jgi:NAD(P)-dependent dehydrogenase (short-subunit alcohol dehydrogenase family)
VDASAGPQAELNGKVCLVTGATAGIGKEIARGLAARGATVLLVGRSRESAEAAAAEIGSGTVEPVAADLSSQAEVRRLAADVQARHDRLDVLVNDAAVFATERRMTADGVELMLATNFLAPFLLTTLLLDRLRASAPARVVSLVTPVYGVKIDWDDLNAEKRFRGSRQNAAAKLALVMFTFELARRLEGTGVTANCVFPGFVDTGHNYPGTIGLVYKLGKPFLKTVTEGAAGPIYLASSPEVDGVSGAFYSGTKRSKPAKGALDQASWRRAWEAGERLTAQS